MTRALGADLAVALGELARIADQTELRDPWWVFGGAAMALAGLTDRPVPDIDVLTSPGDARRLVAALEARIVVDPDQGIFRSRLYARTEGGFVPIEIMAGLEVRTASDWRPVIFESRRPVALGGSRLYIPAPVEQIAMARVFGRPKDLDRADALERLSQA